MMRVKPIKPTTTKNALRRDSVSSLASSIRGSAARCVVVALPHRKRNPTCSGAPPLFGAQPRIVLNVRSRKVGDLPHFRRHSRESFLITPIINSASPSLLVLESPADDLAAQLPCQTSRGTWCKRNLGPFSFDRSRNSTLRLRSEERRVGKECRSRW